MVELSVAGTLGVGVEVVVIEAGTLAVLVATAAAAAAAALFRRRHSVVRQTVPLEEPLVLACPELLGC